MRSHDPHDPLDPRLYILYKGKYPTLSAIFCVVTCSILKHSRSITFERSLNIKNISLTEFSMIPLLHYRNSYYIHYENSIKSIKVTE